MSIYGLAPRTPALLLSFSSISLHATFLSRFCLPLLKVHLFFSFGFLAIEHRNKMHGYSSSEESDDPRRPRSQPASSGNNQDQKKKRKKRLPPQQSINKVWKKFSNRKFHKALSVLPFDPVVAPRSGLDRPNELITEGYEKAAEECRRKVQKIVKECKRVNMRYRDPGWDLVSDRLEH